MESNELINIQVGSIISYNDNEYEIVKEDEYKFLSYQKLSNGKRRFINIIKSYLPFYIKNGLKIIK